MLDGDLGLGLLALGVLTLVGVAVLLLLAILVIGFRTVGREARRRRRDARGKGQTARLGPSPADAVSGSVASAPPRRAGRHDGHATHEEPGEPRSHP